MDALVPICVPLVNPDHMDIVNHQVRCNGMSKGFIVTNANCSTTGLVVVLKALKDAFGGIECCVVNTLQALS
jgi:aspartate-semialdehyde dehydrogenase